MHEVISKQNDPDQIKLLRASAAAYTSAKSGEIKVTYALLFLSIAYPLCYLFIKDDLVRFTLFGFSFLLTVLVQIFAGTFRGNTSKGAIFKEEFDITLFNLRWKSTLKRPGKEEVTHYSNQYRGNDIKDWYSTSLSKSVPFYTAVAVLQYTNTSWDIELRKKFRRLLIVFLICYVIILFTLFVFLQTNALTIFLLLFSLLSFFIQFITLINGHTAAIEKRQAISNSLDESIRSKKTRGADELRDIQDEIFFTRQESSKVPNFYFRWNRDKLNDKIEDYIKEVNKLYN